MYTHVRYNLHRYMRINQVATLQKKKKNCSFGIIVGSSHKHKSNIIAEKRLKASASTVDGLSS